MQRRSYIYDMKSRPWLRILVVGTVLFFASIFAVIQTGNPNFYPTILLLGSFLIPVVFVVYFYEHIKHREISVSLLTTCFLAGGVIGAVTGGLLEYNTLRGFGPAALVGVGLIEEGTKLLFPLYVYIGWRYRHEADGLLFGVASGMGFAALETMGYGLVFLLQSGGDVLGLQQLLIIRGFLSPAEHAAWTGFVAGVVWREREHGHWLAWPVFGSFALVVMLHVLWDVVNSVQPRTFGQFELLLFFNIVLVIVSLTLLAYRYRKAKEDLAALGGGMAGEKPPAR